MLELGLVLASGKACVVVNPSNFYRYDNVQQTSLAYGVLPSSDFDQGYLKLVDKIELMEAWQSPVYCTSLEN